MKNEIRKGSGFSLETDRIGVEDFRQTFHSIRSPRRAFLESFIRSIVTVNAYYV